jgi:hypothetical protein
MPLRPTTRFRGASRFSIFRSKGPEFRSRVATKPLSRSGNRCDALALLTPGFWLLAPQRKEQALIKDPTKLGNSADLLSAIGFPHRIV